MFLKPSPRNIIIKRSTMLAAAPIFFLVLLALWTIVNTRIDAADNKQLANDVFEVVKQVHADPNTEYQGIGMAQKGATLSLFEKYDDTEADDSAALDSSDKRCFSVSENIPPILPEQSQWN